MKVTRKLTVNLSSRIVRMQNSTTEFRSYSSRWTFDD